jgi:hypothetical protein
MIRKIYKLVFLVLVLALSGSSDSVSDRPELLERLFDTNVETVHTEIQRKCSCRVTITLDENHRQFLLTFHLEPYNNDIEPVFFMHQRIIAGFGLKVHKIIPYEGEEITVCKQDPEDKRGKLIRISSFQHPDLSGDGYDYFKASAVFFQQRVLLQDRFPSKEGLYSVTYVHPWGDLEGTNVKFFSNTLLFFVASSKRMDELSSLLKDNPELKLASYQMKYPTNSEIPEYDRPLEFFDKYIKIGMLYDEVLFLMGSPDTCGLDNWHWGYDISPVGGLWINFENGKVAQKGFAFDQP